MKVKLIYQSPRIGDDTHACVILKTDSILVLEGSASVYTKSPDADWFDWDASNNIPIRKFNVVE
jgi:hypothetical protein